MGLRRRAKQASRPGPVRYALLTLVLAWAIAGWALTGCSGDTQTGPADALAGDGAVTATDGSALPDSSGDTAPDVAPDVPSTEDTAPGADGAADGAEDGAQDGDGGELAPLALSEIDPSRGDAGGGEYVTLRGTGFAEDCAVAFGPSLARSVFRLSSEELTVETPPSAPGLVDVTVTCPELDPVTLVEGFLFYRDVDVRAVDPPLGPAEGGTPVTVRGFGFTEDAQLVIGGRLAVQAEVIDDGTIIAITPPGRPGAADIHVSQSNGVAVLRQGFLFTRTPQLDLVAPAAGPVGGGQVAMLHGAGFGDPIQVWFGGVLCPSVNVEAEDLVRVVTPPGTVGAVDVAVSTPRGLARADGAYHYVEGDPTEGPLTLLGVAPDAGSVLGGEEVVLLGTGLPEDGDLSVLLGGGSAEVVDVDRAAGTARIVTPPAGAEGTVDVSAMGTSGGDTLTDAFTYRRALVVTDVQPDTGPASGGTPITVLGAGFTAATQLFVGALPASELTVVSDTRLQAITPAGSPGFADVRVAEGAEEAVLTDGFLFDAPFQVYGIVPTLGAVAGGTSVEIFGAGFTEDSVPTVGGQPCSHVTVLDPTRITAKTPPGEVGAVDVAVTQPDGASDRIDDGFTYYDPTSAAGGTWGGNIEGSLNVTVLDDQAQPVADAYVILRTDPDTPYQGWTNAAGQITFSGADVAGSQSVSASKECYSAASVVEFNAKNVTLFMAFVCSSGSGTPPSFTPAVVTGRVNGLDKYVIPPPGRCDSHPSQPVLCTTCTTDADCGGGQEAVGLCIEVEDQGRRCMTRCDAETPCPAEFSCKTVTAGDSRCFPDSGRRTAICRTTRPEVFQPENPDPGSGKTVDQDRRYQIATGYGELAIVCIGGWEDIYTGEFTPARMGVARHVQPTLDQPLVENVDVDLEIPLDRTLSIRADGAKLDSSLGPQFLYGFVWLDLGSDGYYDFEIESFVFDEDDAIRVPYMPAGFTGAIFDASFTVAIGAFSTSDDNTPYAITLHRNITSFDDDSVLVRDTGGLWQQDASGIRRDVHGLWGRSDDDVWGVGSDGLVSHFDGNAWSPQPADAADLRLNAIWGDDDGIVIVGAEGTVLRFDGGGWTREQLSNRGELKAVWGAGQDDLWVVGQYSTQHWDGSGWTEHQGVVSRRLEAVWGAASDEVWAVGEWSPMLRWDGAGWQTVPAGTTSNLRAIWGSARDDVWAVGDGGTIVHWDGSAWTAVSSGVDYDLLAVWGRSADEVWAVGRRGTILRWDGSRWRNESIYGYTNALQAVWAAVDGERAYAMGSHELLLGPIVGVPRFTNPIDGGNLVGDTLEWEVAPETTPAQFMRLQVDIPTMMGDIPAWTLMVEGSVRSVALPDFENIAGTPGLAPGFYKLTAVRGLKDGFDFDEHDLLDLNQLSWRSWAIDVLYFSR